MEKRWLRADDYDELLEMLNTTFANKYGREVDFLTEQPKMWVRDDEHMGRHLGIYEDGRLASVAGIYPLPTVIMGEKLNLMTTGNVATLPAYEGRGCFTKIFSELMKRLDELGADAARLGGARQRYARFGYEQCGISYRVEYTATNRIKCFGNMDTGIEFKRVLPTDKDSLRFIRDLVSRKPFFVVRGGGDLDEQYRALTTKHSLPYLALRGGEPCGYISAVGKNTFVGADEWGEVISEIGALSEALRVDMINAWQKKVGKDISFTLAPHEVAALSAFGGVAEQVTVGVPSSFKVINYDKIANALMKLKASYTDMPIGEGILGIREYGNLRFYNTGCECGCELTDKEAAFTVDRLTASRVIFGYMPPSAFFGVPREISAFLPLPLSWNTLDYT